MLPQIDNQMTDNEEELEQITEIPSKTYKLNINSLYDTSNEVIIEANRIIGYIDNLDAIRQAIYHILSIERGSYEIYDEDYGVELEQYFGESFEFLEATIEGTLQDALTYDLRIENVTVDEINKISSDKVEVKFTVESIYGDLQLEVNIDV